MEIISVSFLFYCNHPKEIEWLKEAVQNNCDQCPYLEPCNESAKQDDRLHGKVQHTCKDFLGETIEFIIESDV